MLPETECSGLFPAKSLINHSCDANASIEWLHDSSVLSVIATRAIRKGEEVCHCYIPLDQHEGVAARRHALQAHSHPEYAGFVCDCPRCVAELAAESDSSTEALAAFEHQARPPTDRVVDHVLVVLVESYTSLRTHFRQCLE